MPNLNIGDLIKIKRKKGYHWAIFIGNDKVVHLTPGGKVAKESFDAVVGADDWDVSNLDEGRKPLSPKKIIKNAESMVGEWLDPSKVSSEEFVKALRYGDEKNILVTIAGGIAGAAIAGFVGGVFFPPTFAVLTAGVASAAVGSYIADRIYSRWH